MQSKNSREEINLAENVFDLDDIDMPKGAWWWWFWLFFFENPDNPARPQQLMILWSAKNVNKVNINDLYMEFDSVRDGNNFNGAVAAWYYDGKDMHHNYILEQCGLNVGDNRLVSDSTVPTEYAVEGIRHRVDIGDNFEFKAVERNSGFNGPSFSSDNFVGEKGYSIMRANRLDLEAVVSDRRLEGSAYFQRVFVNAPAVFWYWGLFHFENGGILTYYNPNILGIPIKKEIEFYDGEVYHRFDDINVERTGGEIPKFHVWAEDDGEKIEFDVESYSHSSWKFRRNCLKVIPNKLVYNEYPAVISNLTLRRGNKVTLTKEDLGRSVGNAEHSKGLFF